MKVQSSVKPICPKCYSVVRGGVRFINCTAKARHKQRQG